MRMLGISLSERAKWWKLVTEERQKLEERETEKKESEKESERKKISAKGGASCHKRTLACDELGSECEREEKCGGEGGGERERGREEGVKKRGGEKECSAASSSRSSSSTEWTRSFVDICATAETNQLKHRCLRRAQKAAPPQRLFEIQTSDKNF